MTDENIADDVQSLANGPAAGSGVGNNDRLTGTIGASPGKATDDLLDDMASRLEGMDGESVPQAGYEDESADDLFLDIDPATRAPQFEPNRQAGETLQAWQARLHQEAAQFDRDYQSINWDELRRDDPGEYAARMQEFQDRRATFEVRLKDWQAHAREFEQGEQARYQELIAEHLARERQLAVDKIPAWRDESRRQAELVEMKTYLRTEYGFRDEEINAVADHRHLVLIRKALQWDRRQKQEPVHPRARLKSSRTRQPQDWTDTLTDRERRTLQERPTSDDAAVIRISRML